MGGELGADPAANRDRSDAESAASTPPVERSFCSHPTPQPAHAERQAKTPQHKKDSATKGV
jgi:hypothetical protein